MGGLLGCGGEQISSATIQSITSDLKPIYVALPKNKYDRIEWRWLRYMTNRYFMQHSSFLLRGLEPTRQVNAAHNGAAEIVSHFVPALVEMLVDGKSDEHGFSLEDAAGLVATVSELIFNSESELLETVFGEELQSPHKALSAEKLKKILATYMIHWLVGDDADGVRMLRRNSTLTEETIPHWAEINGMLDGTIKSMDFQRARAPKSGQAPLGKADGYSFEDAHEAVGVIGRSFSSFWETECQEIKTNLVALDKAGTGRVRLSDFYGANMEGEWRFGESEAYLRELGALDESSPWRGKQVIIPNYLQSASNCIVSRPHYLVCCVNECEGILSEVEGFTGAPLAAPDGILELVGNMTSYDDESVKIDASLREQLMRVAETHGGKVPLHGRLFAQWLHYVFPRECPFPHKAGAVGSLTPSEFGDTYIATASELQKHAQAAPQDTETEDVPWMSQWSEEEELVGDYDSLLRTPWDGLRRGLAVAGGLFIVAAALATAGVLGKGGRSATGGFDGKSHFV